MRESFMETEYSDFKKFILLYIFKVKKEVSHPWIHAEPMRIHRNRGNVRY